MIAPKLRAEVEQPDHSFVIEERTPVCGEDFCDRCGYCLACHPFAGECRDGADHRWIVYLEDER